MKIKNLTLLIAAGIMSACGGGGSSSDDTSTPTTPPPVTVTKEQALTQLLQAQADHYILPAYSDLKSESESFQQASLKFCSTSSPNESDLNELKEAWRALSVQWQYAKAIKMGPESQDFRHFRLQFWPDSSNAVRRGVASLLAAQTIDVNAVMNLQDGAQGIPALERLIFLSDQDNSLLKASDKFERCLAVMAIAENVKNISSEIHELWVNTSSGFVIDFKNGSGEYETKQAVLEDFITNWFELIEVIKDNKINDVKGVLTPGHADKAENNLSQTSFDNIKQNFAALELAYLAGDGYGFDEYLKDIHDNTEVNQNIINYFSEINTLLGGFDKPLSEVITNASGRNKLVELINKIDDFRTYLSTDFIQVTELNPNFNSNDGD